MPRQKKTDKKIVAEVVKKPETKTGEYSVSIKLNGTVLKSDTNDILSTIASIKPLKIVTRVCLEVSKGGKTITRFLHTGQARKFFYNKLFAEAFTRGIIKTLNGN